MRKIAQLLLLSLLAASCSGKKTQDEIKIQQLTLKDAWNESYKENFDDTKALDVYVITNRETKSKSFGCNDSSVGNNSSKTMRYGVCKVNVPKNHHTGDIQIAQDMRASSHSYFKMLDAKELDENSFFEPLKKSGNLPLVFVHGFNVKYQEAIFRAAQIAYDLKYQGPILVYSWPSGPGEGFLEDKAITRTYTKNRNNAREATPLFRNFLLALQKNNLKINLLVHSMGHQMVLPVLDFFGSKNPEKTFINELILNAPDYDSQQFSKIIKNIKSTSDRTTIYCSYNDKAMAASEFVNSTVRLGACAFLENVDVINVSHIDSAALSLGHSYYSSRNILTDVFQVLMGINPEKRLFVRSSEPNSTERYYLWN